VLIGAALLVLGVACGARTGRTPDEKPVEETETAVGRFCEKDEDCGPGMYCFNEHEGSARVPDGYCMLANMACTKDVSCPEGTLCSPLPWAQIPGVCLLACRDQEDCRDGYKCDFVELFPGEPDSPRSPGKVCWTDPDG
jgi:hypothetical protein